MPRKSAKRRIRVVNEPFQYRMIAVFLLMVIAGFFLFSGGVALYYWFSYVYGDNLLKEIITLHKQGKESVPGPEGAPATERTVTKDVTGINRLELILPPVLINNLAIMLVLIVTGIVTTQRIAGPLYRMGKDIDRVLAGEHGVRVRFRRKDSFPELAEKINRLLDAVQRNGTAAPESPQAPSRDGVAGESSLP
jgi:methyl-accepting chemotaxis protein